MSVISNKIKKLYQHPQETPFKSAYSEKHRVAVTFPEHSRWTKQSYKEECDINTIMGRYMRTGELPMMNVQYPQYLDCTGQDFQAHMQFIAGAQSMFNDLPSDIRNRFKNDPGAFLDFCSDSNNRVELAQMGLLSIDATRDVLRGQAEKNNRSKSDSANPALAPETPKPESA